MRSRALFGIGLLLALAALCSDRVSAAQPAEKPDEAEALFHSAFEQDLAPADRVKVLERIVKEHAESPWADDALWVLGEAARRQRLCLRVVYYWQFLVSRWPAAHLEDYTRSLDFYRLSPVDALQRLLEAEGTLYTPQPGRIIPGKEAQAFVYKNAAAFNCVPMLVWEELGDCYSQLDKPDLSAAAYARALAASPVGGQLSQRFRDRITRKQELEHARAAGGPAAPAEAAQAPDDAPTQSDASGQPDDGTAPPAVRQAAVAPGPATGTPHSD
jgi:hypothetical protein